MLADLPKLDASYLLLLLQLLEVRLAGAAALLLVAMQSTQAHGTGVAAIARGVAAAGRGFDWSRRRRDVLISRYSMHIDELTLRLAGRALADLHHGRPGLMLAHVAGGSTAAVPDALENAEFYALPTTGRIALCNESTKKTTKKIAFAINKRCGQVGNGTGAGCTHLRPGLHTPHALAALVVAFLACRGLFILIACAARAAVLVATVHRASLHRRVAALATRLLAQRPLALGPVRTGLIAAALERVGHIQPLGHAL